MVKRFVTVCSIELTLSFRGEANTGVARQKPLRASREVQQQTQPTYNIHALI